MSNVAVNVYNHSGTLLKTFNVRLDAIPRAGEIIIIGEKLDNTREFIVLNVKHMILSNSAEITCESFYPHTGESRSFYLTKEGWLNDYDDTQS